MEMNYEKHNRKPSTKYYYADKILKSEGGFCIFVLMYRSAYTDL